METKCLLRAENYFVFGDIKMQPQYPEQYQPQPQPQYYQALPPQAPPYPYPPPYRAPSPIWSQIFSGKGIAALIIVLIAGVLITVALCGAWASGVNVKAEGCQAAGDSKSRGIGDIQNDYSDADAANPTEGSGNGAKYSALYTLIPCSIIVLVFGILCPFTPLFAPHLKKIFAILVIVFAIIAVAISAMGIAFVLADKVVYSNYGGVAGAKVTCTLKLGYAGVVGLVGGIMGLIGGIFLLPSMPSLRPRYRPQYQYAPQPPTAPQYYPPQQPPVPPRQYP